MDTYEKILSAGKHEFLDKGFNGASLRNIAARADVTTGALYGYFTDKEELFYKSVGDAPLQLREIFIKNQKEFTALPLEKKVSDAFSYSVEALLKFLKFIYENFDSFKLVICKSAGTNYENYIHSLVDIEIEYTLIFLNEIRGAKIMNVEIDETLLHILSSSYFHSVFETVEHDMPRDKAESYIHSLSSFFTAGWKKIWDI